MNSRVSVFLAAGLCAILHVGCSHNGRHPGNAPDVLSQIQLPMTGDAGLVSSRSWDFDSSGQVMPFLYLAGGTDDIDKGSVDWGTTDPVKFRMIGDYAGELRVIYDNKTDTIPLVYGYTLWFRRGWKAGREPFLSDAGARNLLDSTLYLNHVHDESAEYVLRIRLRNASLKRIEYFDNQLKEGMVNFGTFRFSDTEDDFYRSHTVDTVNPYPPLIKRNLRRMIYLLYSLYQDVAHVKGADIPPEYQGPSVRFSGGPEADILTSVFHHNLADQVSRVDTSGIVHESAFKAPSWFYDGFGTWTNSIGEGGNGSYYDCYYTRNKTIMILPDLDYIEKSDRALALLDKQLMYFPENFPELRLAGKRIPGHWTVIANKPLVYSQVLTGVGWPTQYTEAKFGKHYRDFGNPETDGHGHSMMSHWKTWHNAGRDMQWVRDRWQFLREAAGYITWSLDNPELSFSKHGLLYGETEAAMNDYSLYCNFPCYLGLLMYAEMADSIGEMEYSRNWKATAGTLKDSMETYFAADDPAYGKIWQKVGFYHENILMTLKEYAGFDLTGKLPDEWWLRSLNTYLKEKDLRPDYFGPVGLGYDHGVITQTAMLLDRMDDLTRWMKNLAHLCYAPRLPKPYIVPECASVDVKRGIIRRQGDIGNGYQQAETVNTILLCAGIDDNVPGILRIMPRLPENWSLKVSAYPVIVYSQGAGKVCRISLDVSYPEKGRQEVYLKADSGADLENVNLRLGPFKAGTTKVRVTNSGRAKSVYPCFESGDRAWVWIRIPEIKTGSHITVIAINPLKSKS